MPKKEKRKIYCVLCDNLMINKNLESKCINCKVINVTTHHSSGYTVDYTGKVNPPSHHNGYDIVYKNYSLYKIDNNKYRGHIFGQNVIDKINARYGIEFDIYQEEDLPFHQGEDVMIEFLENTLLFKA